MINTITKGINIYPDLENNDVLDKLEKLKENYDLEVEFVFEDGLLFTYDTEKYDIKYFPGDIAFVSKNDNSNIVAVEFLLDAVDIDVLVNFDQLKTKISIPLLDGLDLFQNL